MMVKDILDHFNHDEKEFVDRAWEWVIHAGQYHEQKLTDFVDPRQAYILQTLVNRHPDAQIHLDGGYDGAERCRAIIAPDYRILEDEPMGLVVLSIYSGDQKFLELEHADYMGAILSLGIKRSKIGDIHVLDNGCHCIVSEDISSYLHMQLDQVHRIHVQSEILPLDQLRTSEASLETMDLTVASLRLDGIASDVYRLSRSKILAPIKAGRCRVNWKVIIDPSAVLKEGDMISLQGCGRFKVLEAGGLTKKGRYRVRIGKFV
ncbi:YlmH family RNA-binding protein [Paenibacillus sp. CMAA1364]